MVRRHKTYNSLLEGELSIEAESDRNLPLGAAYRAGSLQGQRRLPSFSFDLLGFNYKDIGNIGHILYG